MELSKQKPGVQGSIVSLGIVSYLVVILVGGEAESNVVCGVPLLNSKSGH